MYAYACKWPWSFGVISGGTRVTLAEHVAAAIAFLASSMPLADAC
jgi:hypothetical protein